LVLSVPDSNYNYNELHSYYVEVNNAHFRTRRGMILNDDIGCRLG